MLQKYCFSFPVFPLSHSLWREKRMVFANEKGESQNSENSSTENPNNADSNSGQANSDSSSPENNNGEDSSSETQENSPETQEYDQRAPLPTPRGVAERFLEQATEIHSGFHPLGKLGNALTGRVWKASSKARETEIALLNATGDRTGLVESALATFERNIGYFGGTAEKQIRQIDTAIRILQDSLGSLDRKINSVDQKIAKIRAHRFNISKWRVDKRAYRTVKTGIETVTSAGRYAFGNIEDHDFEGKANRDAKTTLESLLTKYRQKKSEIDTQRSESAQRDQEKVQDLSELFGKNPEEVKMMLGSFFQYRDGTPREQSNEMLGTILVSPAFPSQFRNARDFLSSFVNIFSSEEKIYISGLFSKQSPEKAIESILSKSDITQKLDSGQKNMLQLFLLIEKCSKGNKVYKDWIFELMNGMGSALRSEAIEQARKEKNAFLKEKETEQKALQKKINDYFQKGNFGEPIQEGNLCDISLRSVGDLKSCSIEKLETYPDHSAKMISLVKKKESENLVRVVLDLEKSEIVLSYWTDDQGKHRVPEGTEGAEKRMTKRPLTDFQSISHIW